MAELSTQPFIGPGLVGSAATEVTSTAASTGLATLTIADGGLGYIVNDVLTVAVGVGGTVRVTTIGALGVITALSAVLTAGSGYSAASAQATSGGTGAGATVDTTIVGANPATLSNVTGLNIAAGIPIRFTAQIRKSAGAGAAPIIGINLNGSNVLSTASGDIIFAATNEAEYGVLELSFIPGDFANGYNTVGTGYFVISTNTGTRKTSGALPITTIVFPAGPITAVALTSDAVSYLITVGAKNLRVYAG